LSTTITIVGLGPGPADDLTRRAWDALSKARAVYLRTSRHPCVPDLPQGPEYHSFDALYDSAQDFAQVYETIASEVLKAAQEGDLVYAVPGDPWVGESTTSRIIEEAQKAGIHTQVISGISFIEPMLALIGVDGMDSLQVLDGLAVAAMHHPPINPDAPALLGQVYSKKVASDVKLTLMNQYPDDFQVKLIHGAGTPDAVVEALPLYEIDRSAHIQHLTSLYVPPLGGMSSFERFQEIIAHLRAPEGCPWDRKQTHESLRPFLLEEAFEVLETIDAGDWDALAEELGDLLLQIVLHTQIATEAGEFYMADVLRHVNEKMIRRHPHVWGEVTADNPDQVVRNWEALKQQEKATRGENGALRESLLDGLPKGLPALMQSQKYQQKAAKVGFDWTDFADVTAKIQEELDEIGAAENDDERFEEVGDLLFMIVNWARHLGIDDPESALRAANAKFYRRFHHIEQAVAERGGKLQDYSLAELDALWDEAKALGL
jgi:tetrapyrrole methylase family protein / MazG family protein